MGGSDSAKWTLRHRSTAMQASTRHAAGRAGCQENLRSCPAHLSWTLRGVLRGQVITVAEIKFVIYKILLLQLLFSFCFRVLVYHMFHFRLRDICCFHVCD